MIFSWSWTLLAAANQNPCLIPREICISGLGIVILCAAPPSSFQFYQQWWMMALVSIQNLLLPLLFCALELVLLLVCIFWDRILGNHMWLMCCVCCKRRRFSLELLLYLGLLAYSCAGVALASRSMIDAHQMELIITNDSEVRKQWLFCRATTELLQKLNGLLWTFLSTSRHRWRL